MAFDPASAAQNYQTAMGSSVTREKYKKGVAAVTVSPMAKAADNDQKYLENVRKSVDSGRRGNKMRAMPIDAWRGPALAKGADRLQSGATASQGKVAKHFQDYASTYEQIINETAAMPNNSIDDGLARVRKSIELLKAKAGKL